MSEGDSNLIDWNGVGVELQTKPLIPIPISHNAFVITEDNPFDFVERQIENKDPFDMPNRQSHDQTIETLVDFQSEKSNTMSSGEEMSSNLSKTDIKEYVANRIMKCINKSILGTADVKMEAVNKPSQAEFGEILREFSQMKLDSEGSFKSEEEDIMAIIPEWDQSADSSFENSSPCKQEVPACKKSSSTDAGNSGNNEAGRENNGSSFKGDGNSFNSKCSSFSSISIGSVESISLKIPPVLKPVQNNKNVTERAGKLVKKGPMKATEPLHNMTKDAKTMPSRVAALKAKPKATSTPTTHKTAKEMPKETAKFIQKRYSMPNCEGKGAEIRVPLSPDSTSNLANRRSNLPNRKLFSASKMPTRDSSAVSSTTRGLSTSFGRYSMQNSSNKLPVFQRKFKFPKEDKENYMSF